MHELIQDYFDTLYHSLNTEVVQSMPAKDNEIYGELYYYSVVTLLQHIDLKNTDHFLDIGSGLGKLIFQIYLTTPVSCVTGIEINHRRYQISQAVQRKIEQDLPLLFNPTRSLSQIEGDFLSTTFPPQLSPMSIAYVCATVFSLELILAIGKKIDSMDSIHTVISLRKIPNLSKFILKERIFLHGTWDRTACYIYRRK